VRKPAGRYHHGELRRALVETALLVVERDGVGALSLRDLARRLGVSHAAPAHHFVDRAALLAEIAREGFDRLTAAMSAAAQPARDPRERLDVIGRAYVRFALEHPAFFRVMFGREVSDLADPPAALGEAGERSFAVLLGAVDAILASHRAPERPPADAVAFTCWCIVHGAAMLWIDGPLRCQAPPGEARARFERGLAFTFDFLRGALAAESAPPRRR